MRQALLAIVAAAILLALHVAPASANAEWCEHDPLVVMRTPRGATVEAWVTAYARGAQYAPNLDRAIITYVALPARTADGWGTRFEIIVIVPEGPRDPRFQTRAVLSSDPNATGTIHDTAEGWSNRAMRLTLIVATP